MIFICLSQRVQVILLPERGEYCSLTFFKFENWEGGTIEITFSVIEVFISLLFSSVTIHNYSFDHKKTLNNIKIRY